MMGEKLRKKKKIKIKIKITTFHPGSGLLRNTKTVLTSRNQVSSTSANYNTLYSTVIYCNTQATPYNTLRHTATPDSTHFQQQSVIGKHKLQLEDPAQNKRSQIREPHHSSRKCLLRGAVDPENRRFNIRSHEWHSHAMNATYYDFSQISSRVTFLAVNQVAGCWECVWRFLLEATHCNTVQLPYTTSPKLS